MAFISNGNSLRNFFFRFKLTLSNSRMTCFYFFLHRNFYRANPRPDALMKEQIVEMSGLSPRVIRVWFQNKRCKDKKTQIKQEMQQERVSYYHLNFKRIPII